MELTRGSEVAPMCSSQRSCEVFDSRKASGPNETPWQVPMTSEDLSVLDPAKKCSIAGADVSLGLLLPQRYDEST